DGGAECLETDVVVTVVERDLAGDEVAHRRDLRIDWSCAPRQHPLLRVPLKITWRRRQRPPDRSASGSEQQPRDDQADADGARHDGSRRSYHAGSKTVNAASDNWGRATTESA